MKAVSFFSGGKDGLFATYLAQKNSIDVKYFLLLKTTIGVSPHYENLDALKLIADACNKELLVFDMSSGQNMFVQFLKALDVGMIISGDIFLEPHYEWLKELASKSHKEFFEPLWHKNTGDLVYDMLNNNFFYTIIASSKSKLSKKWLGYNFAAKDDLDNFLKENPSLDPAGEAGEFHTVVTYCPLYSKNFKFQSTGSAESKEYYYLHFSLDKL